MSRRVDDLVAWWVRLYTRGLAGDVAQERRDEIRSDVFEHRAAARSAGMSDGQTARGIAWRACGGVGADIMWRERELRLAHRAASLSLSPAQLRAINRVTVTTFILGALLVGVGVLAIVRLWTPGGIGVMAPSNREGILAATVASIISLFFAARPSSRAAGMFGLAFAVVPLMYGVMRGMDGISARASYLLFRLAHYLPGEVTMWLEYLGPGLLAAMFFFGSALWLRRHSPKLASSTFSDVD